MAAGNLANATCRRMRALIGSGGRTPESADRRLCRGCEPAVPVVFCSGYTANLLEDELLLNPDTNFLRKPYTASELLAALQAALARKPGSLD